MAGNPAFQNLDPMSVPDPITPADAPGDAAGYGMVTPHGRGTAPYDIQQDLGGIQAEVQASFNDAVAATGAGVLYPQSPRQAEAEKLLDSPAGFSSGGGLSGYDILTGWSGESAVLWPNDVQANVILETPVQGEMGTYPEDNTYQPGLQKYGTD